MHKKGFVYLVGAGCGSADLITVRGLRLLQSCDAVVYDDLIDPALLAQAAHAEQHPAGKRCGRHSMPQSEINSLLVRLGQSGKTVVRLKGGDPFVFGRGGEEFLALQAAGVPCEEVPGISSCIAVPAAAGIPVTHRGASRSFHVITGHTAQTGDTLPESLEALAALHGTLVFLMGLNSLEQIAARLTAAGKPPETPAAVVSGGNAPHPATVRGTLADIAEKARAARVQAPAVIVVGAAAALELGDVAVETLRKRRDAAPQSVTGSIEKRRANISGAYEVIDPELVEGRRILLIDDIVTTGATAAECARTLGGAGAAKVVCAALAKAE